MLIPRLVLSCLLPAFLPRSRAAVGGVKHEERILKAAVISWNMDGGDMELPKDKAARHEYLKHVFVGNEIGFEDIDIFMIATAETGHGATHRPDHEPVENILGWLTPTHLTDKPARDILDQFTQFFNDNGMVEVGYNKIGFIANVIYAKKDKVKSLGIEVMKRHELDIPLGEFSMGPLELDDLNNKGAAVSVLKIGEKGDERFIILSAVHFAPHRGTENNRVRKRQLKKVNDAMDDLCIDIEGCKIESVLKVTLGDMNWRLNMKMEEKEDTKSEKVFKFHPGDTKEGKDKPETDPFKCFSNMMFKLGGKEDINEVKKKMYEYDEGTEGFSYARLSEACPSDSENKDGGCLSYLMPTFKRAKDFIKHGLFCFQTTRTPGWPDRHAYALKNNDLIQVEVKKYGTVEYRKDDPKSDHVPVRGYWLIKLPPTDVSPKSNQESRPKFKGGFIRLHQKPVDANQ